ncbi:MAG: N-acetylmuramoyl-L-alanine amidase [Verrucomicrobia bacterium]|nr:N-acetylmuramoyl-L-alanine amidase [Verrucomicrobiota bacterium]
MPKLWRTAALVLALLGLTGCPSLPKPASKVTPLPTFVPPTERVAQAPGPPAPAPLPSPPSLTTNFPVDGWVAFGKWSESAGLGRPERVPSGAGPTYELRTTNGVLALEVGTRAAQWNGLECWLGFAPKLVESEPLVHALDMRKNILPLLLAPAVAPSTNRIVVIDPGHGGKNSGTTNIVNQRTEKEFTLDWAKRLRGLLATNGWTVVLTRTNDAEVSLADRVALAERVKADLFVSLHFNSAFPKTDQAGLETYCLTPTGLPSSLVRDFADDPKSNFPNNAFDAQNLRLALQLHAALVRGAKSADRGVRRARFMDVLRGQKRPAVLIEGGYLSNPKEARLIADPRYRQKLAVALADGLGGLLTAPGREAEARAAQAAPRPAAAAPIPSSSVRGPVRTGPAAPTETYGR